MYITSGNVETLLNWFNHSGNRHTFLCLLVAGHLNDEKFFSDVFDKKEIIDVISGHEIAVFLFSNALEAMSLFEIEVGHTEILPGRLYGLKTENWYLDRYLKRVTEIGSVELKNYPIRESAIKTSQTISSEICQQYQLDLDDIPCILFLEKEESEPFVIRTKGEIDIEQFFQLIKDVRKLAHTLKKLPDNYEIRHSIESAKLLMTEQETAKIAWVTEAENKLNESINEFRDTLNRHGIPINACEILVNQETAKKLWEVLGRVPIVPAHPLAVQYSETIENVFVDNNIKRQVKLVIKCAKEVDVAVNYRRSSINKLKRMFPELHAAKDATNSLCQKYERKFMLKAKYRPIKEFIETVLGVSAKARELLSLEESIKKIM